MKFSVNIHSAVAVYVQIENQVRFAIAAGELKAGDRLPAPQKLAKEIGVNINTVGKAYRDLEVMGLVYTRRGMGYYINKGAQAKCRNEVRRQLIEKLHEITQEAKASGMTKKNLTDVINKSLAADSNPNDDVPASVLALARKK